MIYIVPRYRAVKKDIIKELQKYIDIVDAVEIERKYPRCIGIQGEFKSKEKEIEFGERAKNDGLSTIRVAGEELEVSFGAMSARAMDEALNIFNQYDLAVIHKEVQKKRNKGACVVTVRLGKIDIDDGRLIKVSNRLGVNPAIYKIRRSCWYGSSLE